MSSSLISFTENAEIAQLVEHNLAKVRVASSSLVFRSSLKGCSNGGIGRHEGLKIPWPLRLCGFKSRFEYESSFFERLYEYRFMKPFCFLWVYYVRLTPESMMVKKLFNFI